MIRSPSIAYVLPFAAFFALLGLYRALPLPALALQAGFLVCMALVLALVARRIPDLKHGLHVREWAGSILLGVVVFALWIAADRFFPGYRHHWLFDNRIMGSPDGDVNAAASAPTAVLWLRTARAVLIVPIVEELFWRAWMMRWLIRADFLSVPLGAWSARAFWVVAILFATEHGSFWDVGLAAGILYNWWMLRTRSLGDLVLAHAVTNACLSAYVVLAGKWEYWL